MNEVSERHIGRFRVLGELGRGGMGVVYRCWDPRFGDEVAVKTFEGRKERVPGQLRREFRTLLGVSHPNLVPLYELFSDPTHFSMAILQGVPFASRLEGDAPTRLAWTRQVLPGLLDALATLHRRGILHGDIKPENVLVDGSHPVLADFGLSLRPERDIGDTERGGSLTFVPPETLRNLSYDARSDRYSLGVLLYLAVTGRSPFSRHSLQAMQEKVELRSTPSASLGLDLPASVTGVLDQLLLSAPEDRPSLEAIADAFEVAPPPRSRDGRRVMLGRLAETNQLLAVAAQTPERPRIASVLGPSGMGKSTLLAHARSELRTRGFLVLEGLAHPREAVPYKAFDAMIDGLVRWLDKHRELEVPLAVLAAAGQAFPRLTELSEAAEPTFLEGRDPEEARAAAFQALKDTLRRVAGLTPLAVLLDDFQWSSPDCRALLEALVDPLGQAPPVLWVVAQRDEEPEAIWSPRAGIASLTITLRALDEAARNALWAHVGGGSPDTAKLDHVGGTPAMVVAAALRSRRGPTPQDDAADWLDAAVRVELDELAPASRALVRFASFAEGPIHRDVLIQASEVGRAGWRLLYELEARHWIRASSREDGGLVHVYHDRIGVALRREVPQHEQTRIHTGLLEALLDDPARAASSAYVHALGAGRLGLAANLAMEAADEAERAYAFADAAGWVARTLDLPHPHDEAALCERRARLLAWAGLGGAAAEAYVRAADLLGATPEHAEHAMQLRQAAAEQLVRTGASDEGIEHFREVLEHHGERLPGSDRAALFEGLWHRGVLILGGWRVPSPHANPVAPAARRRLEALHTIGFGLASTRFVTADALGLRHLRLALRLGDPEHVALGLGYEATVEASFGGDRLVTRAVRMCDDAEQLAAPFPRTLSFVRGCRASTDWSRGRWAEGLAGLAPREAEWRAHGPGHRFEIAVVRLYTASLLWWSGDLTTLDRAASAWLEEARALGDTFQINTFRLGESAGLYLMRDHPHEALDAADEALRGWRPDEVSSHRWQRLHGVLRTCLYVDDPERGWAEVEREWPWLVAGQYHRMMMTGAVAWLGRGAVAIRLAQRAAHAADRSATTRWLREARKARSAVAACRTNQASGAMAAVLDVGLATLDARASVRDRLDAAATALSAAHMTAYADAALALHPDEEIARHGQAALAAHGVRSPLRFARSLIPVDPHTA